MALFEPGRNCWRLERADKAALIIDACDYYRVIRQAMLEARHRILIIGWDFDPRIKLDRTEPANEDETLGAFLLHLAKTKPDVPIKILRWDFGALKTFLRGSAPIWMAQLALQKAITFRLDGAHPTGCSHHQKIVVVDDCFAVCGGIDMTGDRWDRPAHADGDPDRVRPSGRPYAPWHDATMAVDAPLAGAIADVARDRWWRATGEELPAIDGAGPIWPHGLEPQFEGSHFAVARTMAGYRDWEEVKEVEALFLDMIASAKRFIYAENQYFTSPRIAAAIRRRMEEPDPPEVVIVGPVKAEGWLEQVAMDATRLRLIKIIGQSDPRNQFRVYTPKTAGGDDIYVHAKIMIIDDRILRVGSSNMNNRSLGLDSECDLALEASTDAEREAIASIRTRLMAEHCGVSEEEITAKYAETGSLIATLESFQQGRHLQLLQYEKPTGVSKTIADTELLDPKSPDAMFEGMTRRTLFDGLKRPWRRRSRRASVPA